MHQPAENSEQAHEMEAFSDHDASGLQIRPDPEAHVESPARHDATLRPETAENANEVFGQAVAEVQHEDDQRHLRKSASSLERRLGLRKR